MASNSDEKLLEPTPIEPGLIGEAATPIEAPEPGSPVSPWRFVPSLYFLQGLPVVIVQMLSVTMYKKLGVPNDQIGLWTSLIAWPWIAKMLWGPLVENNGTRRSWIIVTQAIIIAGLGIAALGVPQPAFFALTLGIFFVVAFVSATHDIAADGFYLLALKESQQAFFVGIRSASFRMATIFCTGFLVILAGKQELAGVSIPQTWINVLLIGTAVYAVFFAYNLWAMPRPAADVPKQGANPLQIVVSFAQIVLMLVGVFLVGRLIVILAAAINEALAGFGVGMYVTPLNQLTPLFLAASPGQGVGIDPFPFLAKGFELPFWSQVAGSLFLIACAAGVTRNLFKNIGMGPAARSYFKQDRIVAILGFVLFYRFGEIMIGKMSSPFLIDGAEKGGLGVNTYAVGVLIGTVGVLGLVVGGLLGGWIIAKKGIKKSLWPMVLALNIPNLFYIWLGFTKPASPLSQKLARDMDPTALPADRMPWMHIDVGAVGGSVTTWVADFFANIPSQIYNLGLLLVEAIKDPVGQVILIDQFGYGFGFSAYLVYLMFISQTTKTMQTSHYAISTGLMALGSTVAGVTSGYVQKYFGDNYGNLGYAYFFIAVCVCTIPGMLTLFFIPKEGEDVKQTVAID